MSYRINVYRTKRDGTPAWRVMYDWYDETGKHRDRQLKREEWGALGFFVGMPLQDAKRLAEELNVGDHGRKMEARRNKARAHLDEERQKECVHLPPLAVIRFESDVLLKILANKSQEKLQKNKYIEHWRTCERIIRKVDLPIEEWAEQRAAFYNALQDMKASQSYVGKVLRILNEWGRFYARIRRTYFEPIPKPDHGTRQRLVKTFRAAGRSKASKPLSPGILALNRSKLSPAHYEWLFIAVWFGLRPEEIDGLTRPDTWTLEFDPDLTWGGRHGFKVLQVFMPKVVGESLDDSWKLIPVLYPEQEEAVGYIQKGEFRRPPVSALHAVFGKAHGVYAGRKGFFDLMTLRGHDDLTVSAWLGHLDYKTTRKYYRNKKRAAI